MISQNPINPIFKLEFTDLYQLDGLKKIDQLFGDFLSDSDCDLHERYCLAKSDPRILHEKSMSELLIEVGKV
ncbi:MAG: hypothetical protein ACJAVG_000175, partial [Rickettsiales bacterium]